MSAMGRNVSNFPVPVCNVFREKTVSGQVCYQADVNKYMAEANNKDVLLEGLSLIIDTNDEYDVKNLMEKTPSEREENLNQMSVYLQHKNDNSFTIMLNTISK